LDVDEPATLRYLERERFRTHFSETAVSYGDHIASAFGSFSHDRSSTRTRGALPRIGHRIVHKYLHAVTFQLVDYVDDVRVRSRERLP